MQTVLTDHGTGKNGEVPVKKWTECSSLSYCLTKDVAEALFPQSLKKWRLEFCCVRNNHVQVFLVKSNGQKMWPIFKKVIRKP